MWVGEAKGLCFFVNQNERVLDFRFKSSFYELLEASSIVGVFVTV
jgi:hypothetical protein